MGFESRGGKKIYVNYMSEDKKTPKYKKGDVLVEGWYIGRVTNKFNPGTKDHFLFKDMDSTQPKVVLNYTGQLDYLMEEEAVLGDYCRVSYDSYELLTSGTYSGKPAHSFNLEIDPSKFDRSFGSELATHTPPTTADDTDIDMSMSE